VSLFKVIRRLAYLLILLGYALFDFSRSGLVRRTYEFYAYDGGKPAVEDRMFHKTAVPEADIKAYMDELVLGPVSVDLAPLVIKGVKLRSLMYRDRTVYADFSGDAALPVPGGQPAIDNFMAINRGIRRNFGYVSDVKLFINGNEVFFEEFSKIFGTD